MEYIDRFKRRVQIHGTTNKERYLNQAKDNFNKYLDAAPNVLTATTRNKTFTIAVLDVSEINKESDEKYVTTSFDNDIVIGDIIEIEDNDILTTSIWLVYDRENLSLASHKKFKIKPTNYILKYINNDIIYETPIVKTYQTLYGIGFETDKYLTTGNAKLSVLISDNENTRKLTRGSRFIIDNKVWKVTNDEPHGGYLKFTCEEDEQSEYDDFLNNIANRWNAINPKPNYVIDIADLTTVNRGGASNFVYSIKNNGVEVVNPSMTITIANTSIATYNSVNKTISGINTGTTTLTMVFHGTDGVDYVYTGNVRVILSTSGDINTYQILTNDSSIKGERLYAVPQYATKTFYAQRYLNGIMMDANYTVGYSLVNCTANQVEITINNGKVDVYNKSAINNGASINFTFMDTVTRISSIKTISLVS